MEGNNKSQCIWLSEETVLPDAGEEMGRKGFLKIEGELL